MTATPEQLTTTPDLQGALEGLRIDGAIFLRAEFTEAWSYASPPSETMTAVLRPGAKRLVLFHILAEGQCWISLEDGEKHWVNAGDVIVLPYGDQHWVGGRDEAECVPMTSLIPTPPWERMPILELGAGGPRADFICGYLHLEHPMLEPGLGAFPPLFVVSPEGPATNLVQASIGYAFEESAKAALPASTRLPELLLIEVLRQHLASAPATTKGWIAALNDAVLAPALAALHGDVARKWTVNELAVRFECVAFGPGRAVPRSAATITDPVSHGMADAPGERAACDDDAGRRGRRPSCRLRLRGSLQPRVQTCLRRSAEPGPRLELSH